MDRTSNCAFYVNSGTLTDDLEPIGTVTCQWLGVPCQKWTVISNRILLETRIHSKAIFNSKNGRHSTAHTFYFVFMRAIDVKQATERGGSDYAGKQLRMSSNKYRFPIEFYWKYAEFYWKIWKTQSRPHAKLCTQCQLKDTYWRSGTNWGLSLANGWAYRAKNEQWFPIEFYWEFYWKHEKMKSAENIQKNRFSVRKSCQDFISVKLSYSNTCLAVTLAVFFERKKCPESYPQVPVLVL